MKKNKLLKVTYTLMIAFLAIGCKKDNLTTKTKNDNLFYNKMFEWKVSIPENYIRLNKKEIDDIKNDGKKLTNNPANAQTSNTILMFKENDLNAFTANYDFYVYDSNEMFESTVRLKDAVLMDRISKFMPTLKYDYLVSKENISGLEFRKTRITFIENGKGFVNYITYYRLFKDKLFFAAIVFENESSGKKIEDVFKSSTFTN